MVEHNYDLAYMAYDYRNDIYSLRALFDAEATGRGERDFLGYVPDSRISQLMDRINSTRDWGKVTEAAHQLADPFEAAMPFIPLWQLDFHVVKSQKLETAPATGELDPRTIFDMVEEWRLNR
jgi:ABC-type oligopeptide transport system substrate-binding subunit